MVKPSGETTFHKKFPLFTELLRESEKTYCRKEEKCPATAPVLSERYRNDRNNQHILTTYGDQNNMEKETTESKSGEDVMAPIVLQDPPKCKLKRQLSIDTVERSEALRIHKKAASTPMKESPEVNFRPQEEGVTQKSIGKARSNFEFKDEVDGSSPSCSVRTSRHIDRIDSGIDSDESVSRSRRNLRRHMTSDDEDVTSHCAPFTKVPHIYCSPTGDEHTPYDKPPLLSPNRFNLADIGLTSPFINLTPRGAKGEDEVFVFPDSVAHRKVSPYKGSSCKGEPVADVLDREISERYSRSTRNANRQSYEREVDSLDKNRKRTGERDRERDKYGSYTEVENENRGGYVTPKGFVWPKTATVTEPLPLSPRIVTASPKSRSSSTTSASASKSAERDEYGDYDDEKLRMKLRMLERAHAHAKEIYGSPPATRGYEVSDLSPKSRQARDIAGRATFKSISCVDRSPNEKDIIETTEEVRKFYERSISDPRYSPSQLRSVIQKPSPLARDLPNSRVGEAIPESGQPERFHSPLRDDVRRRLFRKGYPDYDRQTSYPDRRGSSSSHVTTDIPPEVLTFLQSRNFHPEELENLKDILRRGGTPPLSSSPTKSFPYNMTSQGHYGDVTEEYSNYWGQGLLACADGVERPRGPLRERRLGEIDVHVTCDKVQEILRELDHDDRNCKCGKIEEEIKSMAINAYSKILRADRGRDAYEQFQREKAETDAMVYDSMKNLCGIKCLCKYGRTLEDVYSGSVVFRLHCPTLDALLDLWHTYRVGDLGRQIQGAFVTRGLLDRHGCDVIELRVQIAWKDFVQCKEELELQAENAANRTPTKQITVIHARSRSEPASVTKQANQIRISKGPMSPFRERMCSDSSVELSPRRAFQEINSGKFPIHPPPSASRKFFPEVLLAATDAVDDTGSAKSPPVSPTSEQENVELKV
ncbi:uncharacterized protein LOC127867881 [Dreissena polymorpha]|uniref:uncharacterized protein LOC127867881 n=1 Tax=Dreissena polymorpha TaxID=45954 RepID=UPI00226519BD|nr:uncharacterized protein LOC127867881 [Dreissena polymorpha]